MTFLLDALRDKPVGEYLMDDTTPLQDYSSFAGTATTAGGTPVQHAALVKGAAWAPVFNNTVTATYACPVFQKNFESNPFTLETWLRPLVYLPATVATRTNLVGRPSMEDTQQGDWISNGGTTGTNDTSQFVFGAKSSKFVTTTENWGYYGMDGVSGRPNRTVGNTYTASAYVRANTAQSLALFDYGDSNTRGPVISVAANTWYRFSVTFVAGTNVFLSIRDPNRVNTVGTIYIDGFMIEAGANLNPYFDGSFTGAAWTGTANASTSTMAATNTAQKVLSHTDTYDGITVNGTVVSFTTKYITAPDAVCSYDLQQMREAHVAGVHTQDKNSLYVDGLLVDEFTLTDVQQADKYVSTVTNLITGTTTSSQRVAVNGVGFYAKALAGDVIARHFAMGRDLPVPEEVIATNGGNYIEVGVNNADFFVDKWYSTTSDWNTGVFDNVAVVNDRLVPSFTDDTSVAGHWYNSMNIEQSGVSSIYGVALNWDGEGATVEVSLDSTNWETVSRGKNISIIPSGFNPTAQILQIRVGFPGGIVGDTSFLDNLNIMGLRTGTSNSLAGRTLTYTGSYPKRDYPVTAYHDNWGVEIPAGQTVVISADTLTASPARTIELAISRQGQNPVLSMTGTTYQNGAVATATLVDEQWTIMHVVAAADVTGSITITGPCLVGYVGIYDTVLSAGTIAGIYAEYVGTDAPRLSDTGLITIGEAAGNAKIYAHDWSISATG